MPIICLRYCLWSGIKLRFSEMLTILPVFTVNAIPGLTLGCALANAIGMAMGANIAGAWDILIGTAATFLAACTTYALRHVRVKGLPVLATLPPVLFNALIVGAELCFVIFGNMDIGPLVLTMAQVGGGQLVPCIVGGLMLYRCLKNTKIARHFDENP